MDGKWMILVAGPFALGPEGLQVTPDAYAHLIAAGWTPPAEEAK